MDRRRYADGPPRARALSLTPRWIAEGMQRREADRRGMQTGLPPAVFLNICNMHKGEVQEQEQRGPPSNKACLHCIKCPPS